MKSCLVEILVLSRAFRRLSNGGKLVCAALLLLAGQAAWAQSTTEDAPVTRKMLEDKIEEVRISEGLDEAKKAELTGQLETALIRVGWAKEHLDNAAEFQKAIETSPADVDRFNKQLEEAQSEQADTAKLLAPNATIDEIGNRLSIEQAKRAALVERRNSIQKGIDGASARATAIEARMVELRTKLKDSESAASASAETLDQQVALLLLRSRRGASTGELRSLEAELLSQPARERVHSAEQAWINRALSNSDQVLAVLNNTAEEARAATAKQEQRAADELAAELAGHPEELTQFAQGNRELAATLTAIAQQIDQTETQTRELKARQSQIEEDSRAIRRRLQVGGRNEALGRLMMTKLENIPDFKSLQRQIRSRSERIAEISLEQIGYEEALQALGNRAAYLDKRMPARGDWSAETRSLLERLIEQREEFLRGASRRNQSLLRQLVEGNASARQLIVSAEEFESYLVGNLSWVRNFDFLDGQAFIEQGRSLFSWSDWARVPGQLRNGMQQSAWAWFGLLGLLLLIVVRPRVTQTNELLLTTPTPVSAETISHSLKGVAYALILAAPLPLALLLAGHLLTVATGQTPFLQAISPALRVAGDTLLVFLFLRRLIDQRGVGRRFLKWNAKALEAQRRELAWSGPVLVGSLVLAKFAIADDSAVHGGPLGALATLVAASVIAGVAWRLQREQIYAGRFARATLRVTAALGAAVVIMLVLGFQFAAVVYLAAIVWTGLIVIAIKIAIDLLERWLLILRTQLERKTRSEIKAQEGEGEAGMETIEDLEEEVTSLSEAHEQLLATAQFVAIAVAIWVIWSPSLPALDLLDSVTLWQVSDNRDPEAGLRAITLFGLGFALFILVITVLATKHLPALVRVIILENLNISAGGRYASAMLLQYTVVAVGGSMILSTLGWQWSQVQWLVAALGVGIGFGLQEIVANFICGLILLAERPVRVGDLVTVGDASGIVMRIRIRATTIRDFEQKELMVPNKELITGRLLNWTLSDAMTRILVQVGIAYGSDVDRAIAILLELAREDERVLAEPEPGVVFDKFAESSLNLAFRVYVGTLADRLPVMTDMHRKIHSRFAEEGITIAFPQRDVHIHAADMQAAMPDDKGSKGDGPTQ